MGVNTQGDIVGQYTNSEGVVHGFVAKYVRAGLYTLNSMTARRRDFLFGCAGSRTPGAQPETAMHAITR
jgi:hypothetical protein